MPSRGGKGERERGWKSYTSAEISISHLLVYRPAKLRVPSLPARSLAIYVRCALFPSNFALLLFLFPFFLLSFLRNSYSHYISQKECIDFTPRYKDSSARQYSSDLLSRDLAAFKIHFLRKYQWTRECANYLCSLKKTNVEKSMLRVKSSNFISSMRDVIVNYTCTSCAMCLWF